MFEYVGIYLRAFFAGECWCMMGRNCVLWRMIIPDCKQWCFMENVAYRMVSIGVFDGEFGAWLEVMGFDGECWYLIGEYWCVFDGKWCLMANVGKLYELKVFAV